MRVSICVYLNVCKTTVNCKSLLVTSFWRLAHFTFPLNDHFLGLNFRFGWFGWGLLVKAQSDNHCSLVSVFTSLPGRSRMADDLILIFSQLHTETNHRLLLLLAKPPIKDGDGAEDDLVELGKFPMASFCLAVVVFRFHLTLSRCDQTFHRPSNCFTVLLFYLLITSLGSAWLSFSRTGIFFICELGRKKFTYNFPLGRVKLINELRFF